MITPDLHFEPQGHIYTVGGIVKPSCTTVLHKLNLLDYSDVPAESKEFVMFRGSWVASVVALVLKGKLDVAEPTFAKHMLDFMPYVNAALDYLGASGMEPIDIEQPMYDPKLDFAGTPDVTVRLRNRLDLGFGLPAKRKWVYGILDWKCGSVRPGTDLQVSGYELLADHLEPPVFRLAVALRPDGSFAPTHFPMRNAARDRAHFQYAMALYDRTYRMAA